MQQKTLRRVGYITMLMGGLTIAGNEIYSDFIKPTPEPQEIVGEVRTAANPDGNKIVIREPTKEEKVEGLLGIIGLGVIASGTFCVYAGRKNEQENYYRRF